MNSDGGFVTELNDVTLVDNELFSFSVWRELLIDFRGNRKIIKYKHPKKLNPEFKERLHCVVRRLTPIG